MKKKNKLEYSKILYNMLFEVIDEREYFYRKFDDKLVIQFMARYGKIPLQINTYIDEEHEFIKMIGILYTSFDEEKRLEGAIAIAHLNSYLANGNFEYDINDGSIRYKLVQCYAESKISKDLLDDMIENILTLTDIFREKFIKINDGELPLEDFLNAPLTYS